jgi:hypothetical protein
VAPPEIPLLMKNQSGGQEVSTALLLSIPKDAGSHILAFNLEELLLLQYREKKYLKFQVLTSFLRHPNQQNQVKSKKMR